MATTSGTDESDPVVELNNYLQEVKKGENLTPRLGYTHQHTRINTEVEHTVTYTFRTSVETVIGVGKGTSKATARRNAAIQALAHFREKGIPE